ncbi:unnamed protein product [Effrenium voratum]|uniref:Poly(A) RNA polymerase mitochondrial-like central palm domain-containing protein n=1 Tax=Effrenium voratum TaxID=2562239 RepID=A0AA36IHK0_9DINO|nr:unnamed protein product [Effrenium voratum]
MWPGRRGIATSKAGKAALFVDAFLASLQENRQQQREGSHLLGPNGLGIWQDPWEDTPSLKEKLSNLKHQLGEIRPYDLSELLCELSLVIWQLRAWFTISSADLVLEILKKVHQMSGRLPETTSGGDPGLAVLRLLEGYIFFYAARQEKLKEKVQQVVAKIVHKKRLPPCTLVRVEAALVCLGILKEPPCPGLQETVGDVLLDSLACSLAPDAHARRRMEATRLRLDKAVREIFPEAEYEFFGSAVNGFETSTSDVDVVVMLDQEKRSKSKHSAQVAVEMMGQRLLDMEDEWGIYVSDLVVNARVPVLKCKSFELVDIDITFNNLLPLYNSRLLKAYASFDERVPKLGRLVKFWAKSRNVNEALEGTLSSYSHCLLLIAYLQREHIVPVLQRNTEGRVEMFDDIHDVYFLDPRRDLHAESPQWKEWMAKRPEATLAGLLVGFFRFLAYQLPAHSQVVSVRFDPDEVLHKEDYFRKMLQRKKSFELCTELPGLDPQAAENEENEELPEELPEEMPEELPEEEKEPEEDEELLKTESQLSAPSAASPSLGPEASPTPAEFEPPAQKYKLPPEEHELQQAMSTRQVLCIDDPMELGRSLGCSFQGFERLCFEWRRAFQLLSVVRTLEEVREVFHASSLGSKGIYNLEKHRNFPSLVDEFLEKSNKIPRQLWTGYSTTGRSWHSGWKNDREEANGERRDPARSPRRLKARQGTGMAAEGGGAMTGTMTLDPQAGRPTLEGRAEGRRQGARAICGGQRARGSR